MSEPEDSRASGAMNIDSALVRELAHLLAEAGLTEIEVEDGGRRIRVARSAPAPQLPTMPELAAQPSSPPPPQPTAPAPEAQGNPVKSPMVGTAYLSADPASPPFVSIGQAVKVGDTLLIIEAMKVMNPITSTQAGTLTAILIGNGQPVEYDQPLVVIA